MRVALAAVAVVTIVTGTREPPGVMQLDESARSFLAEQFQLGAADFRDLDRRRPVTRTLETAEGREVATLGVIRIAVPPAFYVEQLRNIVAFKQGPAVLQIGAFSEPASADDLARLTLDPRDVENLARCRHGDCDVQLSDDALKRFQREVPWRSAEAPAVADRVMRDVLVDLVNRYRSDGDSALMTYVDANRPLSLADEFRAMVTSPPAILGRLPRLYRHVLDFPRRTDERIEDVVYWSKEKMGPAVIISVTHLAIAQLGDGPAAFAAASKQIYGSHYFDSSLGVTILLEDTARDSAYLVYVNRSRLDALGGFFGGMKRVIVRSRTRAAMGDSLLEAQSTVERRFRARATGI